MSEYDKLPKMTHYVCGLFRRVADRPVLSEEEADRIQQEHMANIRELTERGELITAGPFLEDTDLRGFMIFSTDSVEHARGLFEKDAAIRRGLLLLDLYTWFGPTGLRVVSPAATTTGPES